MADQTRLSGFSSNIESQHHHQIPTAPPTPQPGSDTQNNNNSRHPSDISSMALLAKRPSQAQEQAQYPTPPMSSASSAHRLVQGEQSDSRQTSTPSTRRTSGTGTTTPQSASRLLSQTFNPTAVTSGITTKPVTAEIANPVTSNDDSPLTNPTASLSATRAPSISSGRASPNKRKRELTEKSTEQNTPPHTPRALSSESRPGRSTHHQNGNSHLQTGPKSSRSSSNTSNNAPVSPIKGQLSVSIVEGRGLRPSTAPYVVCIFQLNEDISDGAQTDAMDTRQDNHAGDEDLARGVAMRRLGSDQGKPLSIPGLRSRQSSQTDIAKLKTTAKDQRVTDPTWKHEAVL